LRQRNESPDIALSTGLVCVLTLGANKSLDLLAGHATDLSDSRAGIANTNNEIHNRVSIDSGYALKIIRILLPSADIETTVTFFSVGSLFAIRLTFLKAMRASRYSKH